MNNLLYPLKTMNKRFIIIISFILMTMNGFAEGSKVIAHEKGSITFVVDENLAPVKKREPRLLVGEDIAKWIAMNRKSISLGVQRIVTTSFSNEQNLIYQGKDAFYKTLVDAYANHQSVTLSPDMVWLVLCQGFARYVNAHAEELRPKLVNHEGKMDLVIETDKDLMTEEVDWPILINDFASQIDKHTKDNIAKTITSDFSTTGSVERVASQITLMESVKSYFEYIVEYFACGIPSITLDGSVEDWKRVREKAMQLKKYGLEKWIDSLDPILKEFILAADGKPNQIFWKSMMKKQSVDRLAGGGCLPEMPTKLDGWLLKLFPDENGVTLEEISHTKDMPTEYVRVSFYYQVRNPDDGTIISRTPMELWAGFVGAKIDNENNMVTPMMGWFVSETKGDNEMLNMFSKMDEHDGISLRIQEVPEVLSHLNHIKSLTLKFTGKVVLPEWMDKMTIDRFYIQGYITKSEEEAIKKRFPNIIIRSFIPKQK